ncbi:MAG: hypothetical protein RLZZ440_1191, partial [Planctomycetota bacterium]
DVARFVEAATDVTRQRHPAGPHQERLDRLVASGPHEPCSALGPAFEYELGRVAAGPIHEHDPFACDRSAPGLRQDPPGSGLWPVRLDRKEEPLPLPSRGGPSTDKPRGHDPGVVDHEQIAGREQVGQIPHLPVLDRLFPPPHDEEPRGRPISEWPLGDQFPRQVVVVEIGVAHEQQCTQKGEAPSGRVR